jgi:DNA-binding ferritin-like protein (Dps family)|tara:strand:- start:209 stop:427 length:219 start_codon:yes stop_codon:yes gene_type:complete
MARSMAVSLKDFNRYLAIEKERQAALEELSEILGFDVSFSEEEMINNASESYSKAVSEQIKKEAAEWMKFRF